MPPSQRGLAATPGHATRCRHAVHASLCIHALPTPHTGQRAYVITLSRAGEDNKSFRLTNLEATFQGFAGADYDLQVLLGAGDNRENF